MKKTFLFVSALALITAACKKEKTTTTTGTKTTYNTDVKPIIDAKCATAGCHASGAQFPDLTSYTSTKSNITSILDRMNKSAGSVDFMPSGGSKTQADIDKITKWQSDGLLEK